MASGGLRGLGCRCWCRAQASEGHAPCRHLSPHLSLHPRREKLSSLVFNAAGDWVAVGSAQLGQLLVWEWRSESYVLKQQGHYYDVAASAFSPDGAYLVTGADDAKVGAAWAGRVVYAGLPPWESGWRAGAAACPVALDASPTTPPSRPSLQVKVWTLSNGFCFVTFSDHQAPVTAVQFVSRCAAVAAGQRTPCADAGSAPGRPLSPPRSLAAAPRRVSCAAGMRC